MGTLKPYVLKTPAKIGATSYPAGATVMLNDRQYAWFVERDANLSQAAQNAPIYTSWRGGGCTGCGRRPSPSTVRRDGARSSK